MVECSKNGFNSGLHLHSKSFNELLASTSIPFAFVAMQFSPLL